MSDTRLSSQLPADAARYLAAARRLDPPIDLVDNVMAEVESTPQVATVPDFRTVSRLLLAAAAVLLALAVLIRLGAQNVGPAPTPVPLDQLPSAGQVQARISIEADDAPVGFGHGFLWLTNATTGELIRMDPANGSIASPLQVTQPGVPVPIALTDASVWVADQRDSTLVELDPASLQERRRIPVSAGVSAIAADEAALWVLDREAGEVLRVDVVTEAVERALSAAGSALLVQDGFVWVADEAGALVRIDPATRAEVGRVEVGFTVERLLAGGDSVIAVAPGEPIVRVDSGAMRVVSRGLRVVTAAADDGQVWAVTASNYLVRLDAGSLQGSAASIVELATSGTLAIGAGSVWTTGRDAAGDAFLLKIAPEG